MKFSVERKPFLDAVRAASAPVRRGYMPVLECLHIVAKESRVRVIGTNLDVEVQAACPAAVSAPGAANVFAETLRAALEAATGDHCDISGGSAVSLVCGGLSLDLQTVPVEDFPIQKKPDAGTEVLGWQGAMAFCAPFCADQSKAVWAQGVHFGRGLATSYSGPCIAWHEVSGGSGQVIPSADLALCRKHSERLFLAERIWRGEADGVFTTGKLIDATPPDTIFGMIGGGETFASFDADEVALALTGATIGGARNIVLSLDGPRMTVVGDDSAVTKALRSTGTAACNADAPATICLNAKFLGLALRGLAGSVVNLSCKGPAIYLTPSGGAKRGAAIVPLTDKRTVLPQPAAAA